MRKPRKPSEPTKPERPSKYIEDTISVINEFDKFSFKDLFPLVEERVEKYLKNNAYSLFKKVTRDDVLLFGDGYFRSNAELHVTILIVNPHYKRQLAKYKKKLVKYKKATAAWNSKMATYKEDFKKWEEYRRPKVLEEKLKIQRRLDREREKNEEESILIREKIAELRKEIADSKDNIQTK